MRLSYVVIFAAALAISWLAMQAVHEFGHVLGAWITGGTVVRVVLHPLEISRTDVQPNPHPLVVAWAGPIVGVLLPSAVWLFTALCKAPRLARLLQFFAGFCLIANGAYIAFGSIGPIGDSRDMLRHGTPPWLLWLFGLATVPLGLWLWHRLSARR